MKSIVLIFPYFGKMPIQYSMWRISALNNQTIHFLFFTDADIISESNIEVIKCSFKEFVDIVQSSFDFPIVLDRPYKLCEYKPAYGYILQKYIVGYDYWGFGDLDLVYGDIRSFLTDDILNKYKMFLGWGHLTLYHNDYDTNTYFMKRIDGYQFYKDAYTTSKITFFDEYDHKGTSDKWKETRRKDCWLEIFFDNVSKTKQSIHLISLTRGWKRVLFEYINNKLYMIKVENGKIVKKESLYAHFQHRGFMKDVVKNGYNHFLITPTMIIDYPKSFSLCRIKWYSRNRSWVTLYYRWKDRIKYKIKTLFN